MGGERQLLVSLLCLRPSCFLVGSALLCLHRSLRLAESALLFLRPRPLSRDQSREKSSRQRRKTRLFVNVSPSLLVATRKRSLGLPVEHILLQSRLRLKINPLRLATSKLGLTFTKSRVFRRWRLDFSLLSSRESGLGRRQRRADSSCDEPCGL